jgi:hypothetical protein
MCIFIHGFRVSVRVSGIRGFGFGDEFPPESVFGSGSGFDFGFRFWVHGDFTRSEPDPLPSLIGTGGRAGVERETWRGGVGRETGCLGQARRPTAEAKAEMGL